MKVYIYSLLFTSLSSVILGLFTIYKNSQSKPARLWALACFCCSGWSLFSALTYGAHDPQSAVLYSKLLNVFAAYMCVLVAHFCKEITESKITNNLFKIGYLNAVLITLFAFFTDYFAGATPFLKFNYFVSVKPLYHFFTVHFFFYFFYAEYLLIKSLAYLSEPKRNQVKYILVALTSGYVGGISTFLTAYRVPIEPVLANFVWLYVAIISYAIVKHQLMDIKIVIKKTLYYSCLAVVISLVYLLIVFLFYSFFLATNKTPSLLMSFIGILFIAVTFKPLEIWFHRILERRFFKGTIGEISEQKERLETELERRERLKSVGILAAGMAHEIKNPLTAINTFADYLPTKYNDPEFREKFSRIVKQEVARVKEIVSDLLLFSKPADPSPKLSDIRKIVTDILELLSSTVLKKGITVHVSPDGAKAFVDPDQIKQALLNIIMNALDAMPEGGGELTIRAVTEAKSLKITIQDTGCGIPPDKISSIFDPFYTDKEQGTGLGLAVTHSIVEKNRGKISVRSKVGLGTTFTIMLPLQ